MQIFIKDIKIAAYGWERNGNGIRSENKQKSTGLARMGFNAAIKTSITDLHGWDM